MKILTVVFLVFMVFAIKSVACSCTPKVYAPACELISNGDVVFVGEPLEFSSGVYRFKIDKAYKGLTSELREVKVYGFAGTSCEQQYDIGVKYLIFGQKSSKSPDILQTGFCSGSRKANQFDTDYLDSFLKGETQTVVFGQVLQWVTRIGLPEEDESNPVEGASLILENENRKYTATTDSFGRFMFSGIISGNYNLSARKTPFRPLPATYDISVIKGGCRQEFVQLKANSAIEGTLLYPDGTPAANIRMELLRKNSRGEWYSTYYMWKQTDGRGRFTFDDLETGEYLLGYEIWGDRPSADSPYPTHYFPGVATRNQARSLTLSPDQTISGLTLKLPGKHTKRNIKIKVIYPNGSLSENGLLQFFNYNRPIGALSPKSAEEGVLLFEGFGEREYEFTARYWIEGIRAGKLIVSEPVKISVGGDTEVTLILRKPE